MKAGEAAVPVSEPEADRRRRPRGDDALYWSEARQRWVGIISLGLDGRGKRITKTRTGKTPTEVRNKLKEVRKELAENLRTPANYTLERCITEWLDAQDGILDADTIAQYRGQVEKWVFPRIGARPLAELEVDELEKLFKAISQHLSKRSLVMIKSTVRRSIRRAQARKYVGANVAELVDLPAGQPGRPSRAMTEDQANAVLTAARGERLENLVKVAFALGMRPGELRALPWANVVTYVDGRWRPVPEVGADHERLAVQVWRSSSRTGDTKTPKSRRTLELPAFGADAMRRQWHGYVAMMRDIEREPDPAAAVFTREDGRPYTKDALNYFFKKLTRAAGLGDSWHPYEARHTFVSVLSNNGVKIGDISDAVGHENTRVTESVYRHVIAPEIRGGAAVLDSVFGET